VVTLKSIVTGNESCSAITKARQFGKELAFDAGSQNLL